jgi:hypothetical protein
MKMLDNSNLNTKAIYVKSYQIVLCFLMLNHVNCGYIELYTRIQVPDTTLSQIELLKGSSIFPGAKQQSITLTTFQNVIDVKEQGVVEIDITILSRRSRHILFCLLSKNSIPNPSISVSSGRPAPDKWSTNCDISDVPSVLLLTKRQWLKKPQGD